MTGLLPLIGLGLFTVVALLFVTGAAVVTVMASIGERGNPAVGILWFLTTLIVLSAVAVWLLTFGMWSALIPVVAR